MIRAIGQASAPEAEDVLQLRLTEVRYGARDINLYTFARPDGGSLPSTEPGAHITLNLPNGLERQYSVVCASAVPRAYVVGIKRDPASRGGSTYIHDSLRVGTVLPVRRPRNNFPLVENASHSVLIAGGIGVTPILCMAQRLTDLGRSFELHYSNRSRTDAAFLDRVGRLAAATLHFDDERGGLLPIDRIVQGAAADAHLYCCGPAPMLAAFETACAGRAADHIHVEYFTAREEAATSGGFTVRLARSGREVEVPESKTILHALRDAGLEVPSSCEAGVCGACETAVVSGIPDHRDAILSEKERQANATMMICCSGSKTKTLVLDL